MRKFQLISEFITIFIALPTFYFLGWVNVPMIALLGLVAIFALLLLLINKDFSRKSLWNLKCERKKLFEIAVSLLISAIVIFVGTWLIMPNLFLKLIQEKPLLWTAVVILYPLISVYPQELLYRAFLFQRYQSIFPTQWLMITVSALTFAYVHIVFHNWVAVVLTLAGGFIFARTYSQTKSLFWTSAEHSIYGLLLFTAGLGQYFVGGTVSALN